MMSFRDMTFCAAPCANADCDRRLTDDVEAAADRWWRGMPGPVPIALSDFRTSCAGFRAREDAAA